jgi:hypothetical protein
MRNISPVEFAISITGLGLEAIERPTDGVWRVSALHAILLNDVYTGQVVWNRSTWVKDPDTGRTAVERPHSERIIHKRPDGVQSFRSAGP